MKNLVFNCQVFYLETKMYYTKIDRNLKKQTISNVNKK